jgi:hypothetical protein
VVVSDCPFTDFGGLYESKDPARVARREVKRLSEKWSSLNARLDVMQQRNNDLQAVRALSSLENITLFLYTFKASNFGPLIQKGLLSSKRVLQKK